MSRIIYWRGTIKGRAIKVSTKETKISQAKKFVDDYRLALTSDNFVKTKREKKGVVDPFIEDLWLECVAERAPKMTESTLTKYESTWRIQLAPFWAKKNLSQATAKTVIAFENWYLEQFPGKVFFQTGKYLQMLLNYMHREGYVSKKLKVADLDKTIDGKSKRRKTFRIYSKAEQEALIEVAVSHRARVLITGYFATGARKEELLSLERDKVHFDENTLELWSAKNSEWRTVPLTGRFKVALGEWLGDTHHIDSPYVFPMASDPRRPIYSQLFDDEWNGSKRLAGIKGRARNHDTRHTVASTMANDNWPIPVACAMLDMSPDVFIKTYCHITTADIAKHLHRTFG